jgi:hypothetical protein
MIANVSRKELSAFQAWLKSLPWQETHFLFQTYFSEDIRQQKTLELYQRWLKIKDLPPTPAKPKAHA